MKNVLILLCMFLCGVTTAFAQRCGIEATKKALIAKDPSWAEKFEAQIASLQSIADNYELQHSAAEAERTTTISPVPVIFHIIVTDSQLNQMGGTTGILARINSQITVLNSDYNKANSDASLIPSGWLPYYGNVGVHFGLAHTQPNGYGTPGYELSVIPSIPGGFSESGNSYGSAKHSATGGLDAWDHTKYLNVWCINFADNPGLLGLTVPLSFTGGSGYPANEVGVCINYLSVGKRSSPADNYIPAGTPGDYYDEGRTLTHEIGHVFEIWHPWGDDGGQCPTWSADTTVNGITCTSGVGQDDGLADTPPESDAVYGNPAYTVSGGTENDCCMMHGSVNTQPIGIACLSFLDYTDDIGMHLFTTQQAAAMASMVLDPPAIGIGATGSGTIGESYSLTQNPTLLDWPPGTLVPQTTTNNSLSISPNPTTGIVNITFNAQTDVLNGVTVMNMLGQEVLNINNTGNQNDYYSIDLSGMSKGIYVVRCNFASGIYYPENLVAMITKPFSLSEVLEKSHLDKGLLDIAEKVQNEERLTEEEGVLLFEKGELGFVGALANYIAERLHHGKVYFNRNFHIEPTNVCVFTCNFCSYSRQYKHRDDGWELGIEQMLDIVRRYDGQPVTEVHIVGGVHPRMNFEFFCELLSKIRAHRPGLHIKGFTAVELDYMIRKAKLSIEEGMQRLKDAGLQSMPGGGAEIFHQEVRSVICADKVDADGWLYIHETAHSLGMHSNATMLYGHIEKYAHRIDHMSRLRQLQDKTGGFNCFIPLKFRNKDNDMSHIAESTVVEDLRLFAISRIFMDNFRNLKAYWPMLGRQTAQLTLSFGVNDLDGTIDDTTKIYSMAGAEEQKPSLSTEELCDMIEAVGRIPVERDTLYNEIKIYKSLPVLS